MIPADELARALQRALPSDLQPYAADLAQALAAAGQDGKSAAEVDPVLEPALRALAGRQLQAGDALIDFGDGSQFGDVSIGDVAGGDLTKINLTLAPTINTGLVLPAWMLLALVAGLALAAVGAYFALRGPAQMSGTFNVAVADFALADGQNVRASDTGRRLSSQVFTALLQQQDIYKQANPADVISIWHDSLSWREKSATIGFIGGATPVEREQAAHERLDDLGADMLIYGYLDSQGMVTLHFFVRPELQSESAGSTIGGDYQVGQPLQPTGTDLTTRAGAIFWLIKGLQYDSEGRPDRSLDVLGRAEAALPDWREQNEGKELLALFQTQAALYQARAALYQARGSSNQDEFEHWLGEAEKFVQIAEQRNPDFLRTIVMAGNISLLQAQCELGAAGLPCGKLPPAADQAARTAAVEAARAQIDAAIANYERALSLSADSPDYLYSQGVAPAALGFAYYIQGFIAYLSQDRAAAAADYERAIAAIEAVLPAFRKASVPRLLGEQLQALGSIRLVAGNLAEDPQQKRAYYQAARENFADCAALAPGSSDEVLTTQLAPLCAQREREVLEKLK